MSVGFAGLLIDNNSPISLNNQIIVFNDFLTRRKKSKGIRIIQREENGEFVF